MKKLSLLFFLVLTIHSGLLISAAYDIAELELLKQYSKTVQDMCGDCSEGNAQLIALLEKNSSFKESVRLLMPVLQKMQRYSDSIDIEQKQEVYMQRSLDAFLQEEHDGKKRVEQAVKIMTAANFHAIEPLIDVGVHELELYFNNNASLLLFEEQVAFTDGLALCRDLGEKVIYCLLRKNFFERTLEMVRPYASADSGTLILGDTKSEHKISFDNDGCQQVLSPDGTKKALITRSKVIIRNSQGKIDCEFCSHEGSIREVLWNPDGTKILLLGESNSWSKENEKAILWDLDSDASTLVASDSIAAASWNPDGACIALGGSFGDINIWHVKNSVAYEIYPADANDTDSITWSADGSHITSKKSDKILVHYLPLSYKKYKDALSLLQALYLVSASKVNPSHKMDEYCENLEQSIPSELIARLMPLRLENANAFTSISQPLAPMIRSRIEALKLAC